MSTFFVHISNIKAAKLFTLNFVTITSDPLLLALICDHLHVSSPPNTGRTPLFSEYIQSSAEYMWVDLVCLLPNVHFFKAGTIILIEDPTKSSTGSPDGLYVVVRHIIRQKMLCRQYSICNIELYMNMRSLL